MMGDPVLPPAALERASVHPSGIWVLSTSWQPWLPLTVGALHLGRTQPEPESPEDVPDASFQL